MACNKYVIKDGKPGKDGLSAYEIAVKNGFIGTEQQWVISLEGEKGDIGPMGLRGFPGENGVSGSDGQSSFTSYVFTRQTDINQPQAPTGGSFNNPIPTESRWTDGVPFGQGSIYMSYRIFTSDGLPPQQSVWSNPIIAADSALIDFEWSTVPINPGNPTDNPGNWTNQASQLSIWMAIRTMSNGVWSDWNIIYIKGEKGDDGQAGVSAANIYAVNGSWTEAPALERTDRFPSGWDNTLPNINIGEYVWTSQALIDPITNELVTDWTSPIRINGTPGEDGDAGASIAYRGDWDEDTQYKGNQITIDFVIYDDGENGRQGYLARTDAGEIPIGTLPTDSDYWNGGIENVDALFTDFLVAYSAYIQNLTVGSLRTGVAGERVEILQDENRFKFFNESGELDVEVGLIDVYSGSLNPSPGVPTTKTSGGIKSPNSNFEISKYGIGSFGGGRVLYEGFSSGSLTAFIYANIVGKNDGDEEYGRTFGVATNSLFIGDRIMTVKKPFVNADSFKEGWTGIHNGMEYVNGIAIGPE